MHSSRTGFPSGGEAFKHLLHFGVRIINDWHLYPWISHALLQAHSSISFLLVQGSRLEISYDGFFVVVLLPPGCVVE